MLYQWHDKQNAVLGSTDVEEGAAQQLGVVLFLKPPEAQHGHAVYTADTTYGGRPTKKA